VSVWNYEVLKQKQFTQISATESHFKAPLLQCQYQRTHQEINASLNRHLSIKFTNIGVLDGELYFCVF